MNAVAPQTDAMGQPIIDAEGKPVVAPLVDQREIIKRIADKLGFEDVEELIPSLKEEREAREIRAHEEKLRQQPPTQQTPQTLLQMLGGGK